MTRTAAGCDLTCDALGQRDAVCRDAAHPRGDVIAVVAPAAAKLDIGRACADGQFQFLRVERVSGQTARTYIDLDLVSAQRTQRSRGRADVQLDLLGAEILGQGDGDLAVFLLTLPVFVKIFHVSPSTQLVSASRPVPEMENWSS